MRDLSRLPRHIGRGDEKEAEEEEGRNKEESIGTSE